MLVQTENCGQYAAYSGSLLIDVPVCTGRIQLRARLRRHILVCFAPVGSSKPGANSRSKRARARTHTQAMATRSQRSALKSRMPITPQDMLMGKMPPRMPELNMEEAIRDFISRDVANLSRDVANCQQALPQLSPPSSPQSPPPPPLSPPVLLAPSPVFSQVISLSPSYLPIPSRSLSCSHTHTHTISVPRSYSFTHSLLPPLSSRTLFPLPTRTDVVRL